MASGNGTRPFRVTDFLAAHPPELQLEAVLQSSRARSHQAVTMLVTANLNRLAQLQGLCASWAGVVSAAVYVPLLSKQPPAEAAVALAAALEAAQKLHHKAEKASKQGCQLDILLLSEVLQPGKVQLLFPVNALRNFALLAARTELILSADADLLPGASMNDALSDSAGYDQIVRLARSNKLVVVPTFATRHLALAYKVAAGGKEAATAAWAEKTITHFRISYKRLHGNTDFERWMTAEAPYELLDTDAEFEPWYIAARALVAPWDVRYRGYGRNKVQQLHTQLSVVNSRFVVHNRAFMIHRPHPSSAARTQFRTEMRQSGLGAAAGAIVEGKAGSKPKFNIFSATSHWFSHQLSDPNYRVLVAPAWRRCQKQLSWWQIYGQSGELVGTVTKTEAPSGSSVV